MDIEKLLKELKNNDGATLKNYNMINYKTGYQVATEGKKTKNIKKAIEYIKGYEGNCGIWYSNGIYYIDKSKRINTKKEALKVGKENNQISILKWADMSLIYC